MYLEGKSVRKIDELRLESLGYYVVIWLITLTGLVGIFNAKFVDEKRDWKLDFSEEHCINNLKFEDVTIVHLFLTDFRSHRHKTAHVPIPPIRRKKLPWLKSFSEVLNFRGRRNVASFSRTGLPSGRASRGRFWKCFKNWLEGYIKFKRCFQAFLVVSSENQFRMSTLLKTFALLCYCSIVIVRNKLVPNLTKKCSFWIFLKQGN